MSLQISPYIGREFLVSYFTFLASSKQLFFSYCISLTFEVNRVSVIKLVERLLLLRTIVAILLSLDGHYVVAGLDVLLI